MQYLKILFNSFGEEDFQRFALNYLCSNYFGFFPQICRWRHHLNKILLDIPKDYLCVISKNSVE